MDARAPDGGGTGPVTTEGYCVLCGVPIASFDGLTQCPNCGTNSTPCRTSDDLVLAINLHELSILCHWAERWGMKMGERPAPGSGPGVVYAIVTRLKQRTPALAQAELTVADGLAELRASGLKVWTNLPGIENDPPEVPHA